MSDGAEAGSAGPIRADELLDAAERDERAHPVQDWRKIVEFAEWLETLDDRALAATRDFVVTYGPKLFEIAVGIGAQVAVGAIERELGKRG